MLTGAQGNCASQAFSQLCHPWNCIISLRDSKHGSGSPGWVIPAEGAAQTGSRTRPRPLGGSSGTNPPLPPSKGRAGITGGTPELREAEGPSVTFPKRAGSAAQWKFPSGASAGASGDPAKPPWTLQELGRCRQSALLGSLWGSRGSGGSGGFLGRGMCRPSPPLPPALCDGPGPARPP